MAARAFVDTNVLFYADDAADPEKQARAIELLARLHAERAGVVSLQVLQEYFAAAVRKLHVPSDLARRKVIGFAAFEVVEPTFEDLLAAIDLHRLHGFSLWDAMRLCSTHLRGCGGLSQPTRTCTRAGGPARRSRTGAATALPIMAMPRF